MSRRDGRELEDGAEMEVESVSDDGRVILHFFGGLRMVFEASPDLARFYRRLISHGRADND